ncbi:MAG: SpoIIE family protein phosphatase [Candidatus Zixiibacteriota bacterium]
MTNSDTAKSPSGWPDARDFRQSVRRNAAIYAATIIFVLMTVTGYVVQRQYVATVTRGVLENLHVQAQAFSSTSGKLYVSSNGPDVLLLSNICNRIKSDNRMVHWAGFTDSRGVWIAHNDIRRVAAGEEFQIVNPIDVLGMSRPGEQFEERGDDTLIIAASIAEQDHRLGTLVIASSTRAVKQARLASLQTVLIIMVAMLMFGIPVTAIVVRRLLKPVETITAHLRQVSSDAPSWDIPITGRDEFGYLAATLGALGRRLDDARRELVEKERLSKELEIAREIQLSILPRSVPSDGRMICSVAYRSAREVGGDYYDFLPIDEHRVGILVADVSGKSLPGMLVMLMTRDIVRSIVRTTGDPAEILALVNAELQPNIRRGTFVTMFLGVLDRRTGDFEFASAGHNPLIRLRASDPAPEVIKTRGYPLGMMTDSVFRSRVERARLTLEPGDWLIQFTDGINEGFNIRNEEYGMPRFLGSLNSAASGAKDKFVEHVLRAQEEFVGSADQQDDITLVAVHWSGARVIAAHPEKPEVVNAG